jgi:hypothetical protein
MVAGRVWSARSVLVVKDNGDEAILALLPGAQCAYPEGYFYWKVGDYSQGTRWQEANSGLWAFREFAWQTNRLLIFIQPERFYDASVVWDEKADQLKGYYVNFQLPYKRSAIGFDTLDLDLDIVVGPSGQDWHWKDEAAYLQGIGEGGIKAAWVEGIERAKPEILDRIEGRRPPFDGSWDDWRPEPGWQPPSLPPNWNVC